MYADAMQIELKGSSYNSLGQVHCDIEGIKISEYFQVSRNLLDKLYQYSHPPVRP